MTITRCISILIILFLINVSNSAKPQTFENSKDVVFFTRAEEVVIFGVFKDNLKTKQAKIFKKVFC